MGSRIEPLGAYVTVQRCEVETVTPGGIALPASAQEKPQKAKVVAIGPGPRLESGKRASMDLLPGDLVLLAPYVGTEVTVLGVDFLLVREADILARLT